MWANWAIHGCIISRNLRSWFVDALKTKQLIYKAYIKCFKDFGYYIIPCCYNNNKNSYLAIVIILVMFILHLHWKDNWLDRLIYLYQKESFLCGLSKSDKTMQSLKQRYLEPKQRKVLQYNTSRIYCCLKIFILLNQTHDQE